MMTNKTCCNSPLLSPMLLLAALATGAAGCGKQIRQHEQDISAVQQRYRQTLEERRAAPPARAERIDVPAEKAWLYQPYRATYKNQGLRETLARLAPGLPVSYALPTDYNPRVSSTPAAATVADHLDVVTLQANVGYEFLRGILLITPMTVKGYEIPLFGGGGNIISLGASNLAHGGARENAGFRNQVDSHLSAGNDIDQLVNSVLGIAPCDQDQAAPSASAAAPAARTYNATECYAISATGNLLSITARPQRLALFDAAYEKWLKAVTRQARLKITVIRLDVTDLAQQQVDLSLVRNASIAAGLQNLSGSLVGIKADAGALSVKVENPNSALDASQIILKALAQVGNISIDDTKEVLVYNNRLVTVRNFRTQRFVEQVSIQQTDTGGTSLSTPTIEVGEVVSGQAINILPTLTSKLIGLHLVINEAEVESFESYEFGDGAIRGRLPQNSGSDNVFDITMEDGEIILLASSHREKIEVKTARSGLLPVWPLNRLLDNAAASEKRLTQTLFLVQGTFI